MIFNINQIKNQEIKYKDKIDFAYNPFNSQILFSYDEQHISLLVKLNIDTENLDCAVLGSISITPRGKYDLSINFNGKKDITIQFIDYIKENLIIEKIDITGLPANINKDEIINFSYIRDINKYDLPEDDIVTKLLIQYRKESDIKRIILEILENIEEYKKTDKIEDKTNYKHRLNLRYWELVNKILQYKCIISTEEAKQSGEYNIYKDKLFFTNEEFLLINFGIISKKYINNQIIDYIRNNFLSDAEEIDRFECNFLTGWIKKRYLEITGNKKLLKIDKEIKKTEENIRKICLIIEKIKDQIKLNLNLCQDIKKQLSDYINFKLKEYLIYKNRKENHLITSAADRRKFCFLEEDIQMQEEEIFNYLNYKRNRDEKTFGYLLKILKTYKHYIKDMLEGELSLQKQTKIKNDFIDTKKDMNGITKAVLLYEGEEAREGDYRWGLNNIREFMISSARKGKIVPNYFFIEDIGINILPDFNNIISIIKHIENADPKVFDNRIVKRIDLDFKMKGYPKILIVPGNGEGVFNWDDNSFIIPLFFTKTLEASVTRAVAEYRLDVDENNELRDSYSELKCNKGLGMMQTKNNFLRDYIVWISKESKGYKIMEKEIREWFNWKIAPDKKRKK